MPDLLPITLDDQIACVGREINMRNKVYPKWIESGRMKAETAEREILVMESVLNKLQREKQAGRKA